MSPRQKFFYVFLGFVFVALIGVSIFGVERSKFKEGDSCIQPICTEDIRALCRPMTDQLIYLPSSCSCGVDADELIKKGWVDCPERFQ